MSKIAINYIDSKEKELSELAKKIWDNPEVAYKEVKASKLTAEFLEKEGFNIEIGVFGVPTAVRAIWGKGKPVIGFLGEYDALDGMSQKVSTKKESIIDGEPGHGCGHSLMSPACAGAVIGLKREMEAKNLKGTLVFYGCPAEESLTGKVFMAREGAFKELDIAFSWHPMSKNGLSMGTVSALNSAKFHFKGVTAHAGANPQDGRSALDAAELMNVGANFLREHVTDDVRIHYAFTEINTAANVVHDKTTVLYYVRALSREAVEEVYKRLVRIAEGAAWMTETEVDIEFLGGCYNTMQNKTLLELVRETMKELPEVAWSEEDLEFAKKLNESSMIYKGMLSSGEIHNEIHIDNSIPEIDYINLYGSNDFGDVQHIVPAVSFMTASSNIGSGFHTWQVTSCAGHSIGMKGMIQGAKILAESALKTIENPDIIVKAKEEFDKKMKDKEYICPIPENIKVPR